MPDETAESRHHSGTTMDPKYDMPLRPSVPHGRLGQKCHHSNKLTTSMAQKQVSTPPVDQGWAWMIVLGTMGHMLMIQTMLRSTAILFVEIMRKYEASTGSTSLIPALQIFVQFLLSPFTNVLSVRFGSRPVAMLGGLFTFVGCIASAFATNVWQLYISFGIMIGFGFSCTFAPSFVLIAQYFDKRRAMANGLAGVGAAVGMFTAPLVTRAALDNYGVQGSLLILAAIQSNIFVFASLFRPPSFYTRSKSLYEDLSGTPKDDHTNGLAHTHTVQTQDKWTRQRSNTMPEKDRNALETKKNGKIADKEYLTAQNLLPKAIFRSWQNGVDGNIHSEAHDHVNRHNPLSSFTSSLALSVGDLFSSSLQNYQDMADDKADDKANDNENQTHGCCRGVFVVKKRDQVSGKLSKGIPLFQWNLLKDTTFVLYLFVDFFSVAAVPLGPTFMAAYSEQAGLPPNQVALILSISGVPEFFIRTLVGALIDCRFCSVLYFKLFTVIAMTIECFSWSFCKQFESILTVALLTTVVNGCHLFLIPVVLLELLGTDALSTAMGLSMLVQAVNNGFSPLLAGHLRDLSHGWFWPFALGGAGALVSCGFLLTLIARQKRK